MNKQEIREFLDKLVEGGIIVNYQLQSRMPGLRWTLYLTQFQGKQVFTTGEIRVWISGFVTGTAAERRLYLNAQDQVVGWGD